MDRTIVIAIAAIAALLMAAIGSAFAGGGAEHTPPTRPDRVERTAEEWKQTLTPEEFHILREKGTERAFTGEYWNDHAEGTYVCAACGLQLFHSEHKFDSGTGWPSFFKPVADDRVDSHRDTTFGMVRTEVTCARCGGHLGHVFPDGPEPTGLRYCINSVSLDKTPAADAAKRKKKSKKKDAAD